MFWVCVSVFLAQGVVFLIDELVCHRRRGLGRWEIVGHPLDALTVAAALALPAFAPFEPRFVWAFGGLSLFSCLFVTKDELVHREVCTAFESWLHALLFLFHPLLFVAAGALWSRASPEAPLSHSLVLRLEFWLVCGFCLYQGLYWGRKWEKA